MYFCTAIGWAAAAIAALSTCAAGFDLNLVTGQTPLRSSGSSIQRAKDIQDTVQARRPNIVFILVDDQDLVMGSHKYMPILKQELADQGITYINHFTTTALCCPARVSLWTGKMAHNTNVTDVNPPHGGYPKFISQGHNENYLPVWLQEAGYDTYYTGKLFNAHDVDNYNDPAPAGWTDYDFLLDPGTYSYMNPIYQRKDQEPVYHENHHTMELLHDKSKQLLDAALSSDKPFFLGIAPPAPHSNIASNRGIRPSNMTAPIPLKQHEHLFPDAKIPRTENFNPETPSGVSWIRDLPLQNESSIEYLDHYYRSRIRALQSIELVIESVVAQLSAAKQLETTYIIYTSDNGYHLGQHRLPPGKECGFDEDIRIPLFIRGPGIQPGHVEQAVTTHIDLAPTLFKLAGIEPREDFDGTPIPLSSAADDTNRDDWMDHEHVTIEYWGIAVAEGENTGFGHSEPNPRRRSNNTYKAIRVLSEEYNLYYSVWCNNERELYDLRADPGQLRNLYPRSNNPNPRMQLLGVDITLVINRLDALLMVGKSCKGVNCVQPWKVLHPASDVWTLKDALHANYDEFYRVQAKVSFNACEMGYLISAEGPQDALEYRDGLEWHAWV